MFKAVIYAHDTFGIGHISRAIKVSKAILKKHKDSAIIIITGSAIPNLIDLPKGIEIVKIPTLKSIRNKMLTYSSFNTGIDPKEIIEIRKNIIYDLIKGFKPHILFVDFSPKGVAGELIKSLNYINANLKTKKYLMFRDIIDTPSKVIEKWKRRGYQKLFAKYYDKILVFGDRGVNDFEKEYALDSKGARKLVYLGYLIEKGHSSIKNSNRILLTAGGGRDGNKIIKRFISNFVKINDFKKYQLDVFCGPLAEQMPGGYGFLPSKINKNIKVYSYVPNLANLMLNYRLIVSMGGYNSLCEIIGHRIPALIIPRQSFEQEQLIRARIFSQNSLIDYIRFKDLNAKNIERKLKDLIKSRRIIEKNIKKINTNGIKNLTEII